MNKFIFRENVFTRKAIYLVSVVFLYTQNKILSTEFTVRSIFVII